MHVTDLFSKGANAFFPSEPRYYRALKFRALIRLLWRARTLSRSWWSKSCFFDLKLRERLADVRTNALALVQFVAKSEKRLLKMTQ